MSRTRAFSLLEVCLAFCILGLAMLPMLTSFGQASRGVAQTSEYTQALFLTQMALEDEQARFEVNPLVLLEDEASLRVPSSSVVEGGAHYFQAIEDTAEPFGRMIPGSDQSIEPGKPSLYKQLVRFQISTDVDFRPHPEIQGSTSALAEVQVAMSWSGIDGKSRYFTIPTLLARPSPNPSRDLGVIEVLSFEDTIRRQFYPEDPSGRPLREAAAARGADYRTVQDLGLVVVFEMALEREFDHCDAEIAEVRQWAERPGADDAHRAEADIREGKIHERKASLAMHVPLEALGNLQRLTEGDFVSRLGNPRPKPERYVPHLWRFGHLPRSMLHAGREAIVAFARGAQGERGAALSRRRLLALQYRILEMSHVLLLGGLELKPFLQELIGQMIIQQDGKNPYVVSYARSYQALLQDPERLREEFAAWSQRLESFRGIPPTIDRLVQTALGYHPAIGPIETFGVVSVAPAEVPGHAPVAP